ncbi:hypothetical protein VTI74DRAFT_2957 [Chaetomium olivicolor]
MVRYTSAFHIRPCNSAATSSAIDWFLQTKSAIGASVNGNKQAAPWRSTRIPMPGPPVHRGQTSSGSSPTAPRAATMPLIALLNLQSGLRNQYREGSRLKLSGNINFSSICEPPTELLGLTPPPPPSSVLRVLA